MNKKTIGVKVAIGSYLIVIGGIVLGERWILSLASQFSSNDQSIG